LQGTYVLELVVTTALLAVMIGKWLIWRMENFVALMQPTLGCIALCRIELFLKEIAPNSMYIRTRNRH
jgi:hypothetical protein